MREHRAVKGVWLCKVNSARLVSVDDVLHDARLSPVCIRYLNGRSLEFAKVPRGSAVGVGGELSSGAMRQEHRDVKSARLLSVDNMLCDAVCIDSLDALFEEFVDCWYDGKSPGVSVP
jgi:hypothetical protein